MRTSILRIAGLASIGLLCSLAAYGQPDSAGADKQRTQLDRRIQAQIRSLDDIVWSDITIYELQDEVRSRLINSMRAEDVSDIEKLDQIGESACVDPLPEFGETAVSIASQASARTFDGFKREVMRRFGIEFDDDCYDEELQRAFAIAQTVKQNRASRPKEFYLVTTRDVSNPRIIALLGINSESGEPSLTSFVKAGSELYDYLSNTNPGMYTELQQAAADGSSPLLANKMYVLRDLSRIQIVEPTVAMATYIDAEEHPFIIRSISMGRPIRQPYEAPPVDSGTADASGGGESLFGDMFATDGGLFGDEESRDIADGAAVPGAIEHRNEIVVGTDVLAGFYSYEMNDEKRVEETNWGVELVNGFDELNYPSVWGGRMTLNAILRNVKIGAVLPVPRFGGETVAESGLFDQPQHILGGYGIAFNGDFTAPILANSGLFNFHASYTFGESETDALVPRVVEVLSDSTDRTITEGETAYLIRYAFQGHYTFGFYADADAQHLFRLSLGGSVYGVDNYNLLQRLTAEPSTRDTIPTLTKADNRTIGGISGKLEYMKGGTDIPYGAGFQFFDGSVLGDVWIQFIVARNIDVMIKGQYFAPLFRDAHPWENNSLIVPSLEVKYHFGAWTR